MTKEIKQVMLHHFKDKGEVVLDYNQLIRKQVIDAIFQINGKTIPIDECEY